MKRVIITIGSILVIAASIIFYFNSSYRLCSKVFSAIDNGDFRYAQTGLTPILVHDFDFVTLNIVESIKLKNSPERDYENLYKKCLDEEFLWFQIPAKVNSYKIVYEHKYTDTLRTFIGGKIDINPQAEFWNIKCKVAGAFEDKFYTLVFLKERGKYNLGTMIKD